MIRTRKLTFKSTHAVFFNAFLVALLLGHVAIEVFAASSGTFALTGSLNTARYDHSATLLTNGQVLVTGGAWRRSLLHLARQCGTV